MKSPSQESRIQNLIDLVGRVSRGDLSAQAEVTGVGDDIDALSSELNHMIQEIRARTEAQFLKQRAFFEFVLNHIPIQVVIFDRDFR
ncbi:MAG: HAMP domain-containing protein, partial [Bacteroidota bacterium]